MQNNFENINDETPFIPFDDVWTSLKPELDKEAARREKRKRRFIFFWFTFIAIGLLAGGGLILVKSEELKVKSENQKVGNQELIVKSEERNKLPETPNNISETPNSISKKSNSIAKTSNKEQETSKINTGTSNIDKRTSSIEKRKSNIEVRTSSNDKRTSSIDKRTSSIDKRTSIIEKITSSIEKRTSNTDTRVVKNIFENLQQNKSVDNENKTVKTKQQENIITNNVKLQTPNNELQNNITNNVKLQTPNNKLQNIITNNVKLQTPNNELQNIITNNAKPQTPNKEKQQKQTKNLSYGLQWNLPLQNGLQYNDINADNKPLVLLIPQFWVSKQFGKHSLMLGFNPYSQYFVNNKAVASTSNYVATFYSGSQIDNKPDNLHYTEAILFNKLIAVEASLTYQYQLSSKIKIGAGIGNNWVQGALLKNRVIKNNTTITRDSLYGIDKKDAEWSYIKQTFLLGKIELQYQIKKLDIGVSFSKPISNMFNNIEESRTPFNTNLFVRWKLK